ncbi:hypothetical protein LJC53_07415, partial [Bacteroidales bacterium OttesenSCG-928-C03]|nr:hypothetical protein [Bacteroidales bacterium OttesenSCG-928-C03]
FFLVSGSFAHNHAALPNIQGLETDGLLNPPDQTNSTDLTCDHRHEHHSCGDAHCEHGHGHEGVDFEHDHNVEHNHGAGHEHGAFSWENIVFILLAVITLVIIAFSSEHFLVSHLWEHVIKQHFISILVWTFGVLFFLQIFMHYVDVNAVLGQHHWAMLVTLLLALLIGVIPESGPHLIFVVMFFNGTIPFSILLANSIVQDGHGALPLLAESRKNFILMKGINIFTGLIVGLCGYFFGF